MKEQIVQQVGILECKNLKKMDITGASGEIKIQILKRSNLILVNLQSAIALYLKIAHLLVS